LSEVKWSKLIKLLTGVEDDILASLLKFVTNELTISDMSTNDLVDNIIKSLVPVRYTQ